MKTVNRVQDSTVFTWNPTSYLLTSISVPPFGQSGTVYTLTYDGNHKLDKITDPAGRVLDATVSGGKLVSLKDPDSLITSYAYNAGQSPYIISTQTDTRGHPYLLLTLPEPAGAGVVSHGYARDSYGTLGYQSGPVGVTPTARTQRSSGHGPTWPTMSPSGWTMGRAGQDPGRPGGGDHDRAGKQRRPRYGHEGHPAQRPCGFDDVQHTGQPERGAQQEQRDAGRRPATRNIPMPIPPMRPIRPRG